MDFLANSLQQDELESSYNKNMTDLKQLVTETENNLNMSNNLFFNSLNSYFMRMEENLKEAVIAVISETKTTESTCKMNHLLHSRWSPKNFLTDKKQVGVDIDSQITIIEDNQIQLHMERYYHTILFEGNKFSIYVMYCNYIVDEYKRQIFEFIRKIDIIVIYACEHHVNWVKTFFGSYIIFIIDVPREPSKIVLSCKRVYTNKYFKLLLQI